jgi:hypothetical protein
VYIRLVSLGLLWRTKMIVRDGVWKIVEANSECEVGEQARGARMWRKAKKGRQRDHVGQASACLSTTSLK